MKRSRRVGSSKRSQQFHRGGNLSLLKRGHIQALKKEGGGFASVFLVRSI